MNFARVTGERTNITTMGFSEFSRSLLGSSSFDVRRKWLRKIVRQVSVRVGVVARRWGERGYNSTDAIVDSVVEKNFSMHSTMLVIAIYGIFERRSLPLPLPPLRLLTPSQRNKEHIQNEKSLGSSRTLRASKFIVVCYSFSWKSRLVTARPARASEY